MKSLQTDIHLLAKAFNIVVLFRDQEKDLIVLEGKIYIKEGLQKKNSRRLVLNGIAYILCGKQNEKLATHLALPTYHFLHLSGSKNIKQLCKTFSVSKKTILAKMELLAK